MDHPAVDLWRRKFKLNLSASWKHDVEITVTDLDLWREVLANWVYLKDGKKVNRHPGIKGLLDEYQLQLEKRNQGHDQASALQTRSGERVSEGSDSFLREVRSEAPRQYFRTRRVVF